MVLEKSAAVMSAALRMVFSSKTEPRKLAPSRLAPEKSVPRRSQRLKLALGRLAWINLAFLKLLLDKFIPAYRCGKSAFLAFSCWPGR